MGLFGRSRHTQEIEEKVQLPPQPALPPESVSFETVIGPGSVMKGDLYTPGSVRLEGTFEGDLQIDGNALVGENARVIANITAGNNVTIAGAVRGNVSGQRVQLLRTGRVWGDIEASSISTEEGAFIQGTITMKGGAIPPEFEDLALPEPPEMAALAEAPAPEVPAPEIAAPEAPAGLAAGPDTGDAEESPWEDEGEAVEPKPDDGYGAGDDHDDSPDAPLR